MRSSYVFVGLTRHFDPTRLERPDFALRTHQNISDSGAKLAFTLQVARVTVNLEATSSVVSEAP
jgi:hypothetical protein